jgi:predicted sulfurtransferase
MPPTEVRVRRFIVMAAILMLPSLVMAHQNASAGQPAQAQPKAPKMSSDDVMARLEKGDVFFLDVREPKELAELGTFEGYVNIPLGQLEKRLNEVPKDKPIITA